jgi:hypothetical protein
MWFVPHISTGLGKLSLQISEIIIVTRTAITVALTGIVALCRPLVPFGHAMDNNTNPSLAGGLRLAMVFLKLAL